MVKLEASKLVEWAKIVQYEKIAWLKIKKVGSNCKTWLRKVRNKVKQNTNKLMYWITPKIQHEEKVKHGLKDIGQSLAKQTRTKMTKIPYHTKYEMLMKGKTSTLWLKILNKLI